MACEKNAEARSGHSDFIIETISISKLLCSKMPYYVALYLTREMVGRACLAEFAR